ncbi:MAG: oxygen-independent coproporphyrinogen III oxidase [Deltaproteobacteria bacterium]|nr:oxygen-independent coproporphyrinogen III oxidase [Deltaproteobacteria bacterium]
MDVQTDTSSAIRPTERAVTAELLRRYDRAGPRYTSYPTAVEFGPGVDADVYAERLRQADALGDAPLSLYLHLPFCQNRCLFCGCHVIITPHMHVARPYLDLVRQELALLARHLPNRRRISQLHLGGGTPTYFPAADLSALVGDILQVFEPTDGAELAVEVDPRVTTDGHIDALADLGFNRISLGVQDLAPEVQRAIDRVQSLEDTARIIERARARGFGGVNVDLIYGLPQQTPEGFERTVESVLALGPDRSAIYNFAYVPDQHRGHQRRIEPDDLPPAELKLELFALARERFLEAGYEPIGMDHFARQDDELARARREGRLRRNFQGYTVIPAEDSLGLGISAIGDVRDAYVQNEKKLSTYAEALQAGRLPVARGVVRTADDRLRRDVIEALMCNARVDMAAIETAHGVDFHVALGPELDRLREHEAAGMVHVGDDTIEATPTGELFIRNLAMCFDAYYWDRHAEAAKPVFSRTV